MAEKRGKNSSEPLPKTRHRYSYLRRAAILQDSKFQDQRCLVFFVTPFPHTIILAYSDRLTATPRDRRAPHQDRVLKR
jgi:hypothetical protein